MKRIICIVALMLVSAASILSVGCSQKSEPQVAKKKMHRTVLRRPPEFSQSTVVVEKSIHRNGKTGSAKSVPAKKVLDEAIEVAKSADKKLFIQFDASWCTWCEKLESFLEQNRPLFENDFHFVKIDTERMAGGAKLFEEFLNGRECGLPCIVILDGDGNEIASSHGRDGKNIGCPFESHEISHFVEMIKNSSDMSQSQLREVGVAMEEYVKTLQDWTLLKPPANESKIQASGPRTWPKNSPLFPRMGLESQKN
ncbi:thioredoxin family protein [Mariniblastus fucicola]|uniref:Thioredoxin n=1 Tax=Mariniblastus fucicola TaxID=980251 RepID=A0A5B9PC43_9BACT|nr:thioredoxin family protein [Mariniblastus fucicola]QEG23878.1 Thioredoxin [Mariniblastus fucicola]